MEICILTLFPARVRPQSHPCLRLKRGAEGESAPCSPGTYHAPPGHWLLPPSFTPQTIPFALSHSSGNSGMCSQRKLLCSATALVPYHSSQWTDSPKLVVSLTHLITDKKDAFPLHKPFYLFFKAINKPLITMFPYLRLFRSV